MLTISPIPAFEDNYIWLLEGADKTQCAIVDPGDAEPVIETLQKKALHLDAILITHKHADHIGGIRALKQHWPDAVVYGPKNEPIEDLEVRLAEGDIVELTALGVKLEVLDVPGHTEGHIAYFTGKQLFCGDTLFAGGCGRIFSGTHKQLSQSLQKMAKLPEDTWVYCGHEYTLANLGFAAKVEPNNRALKKRQATATLSRQRGDPTIPSTLACELSTNPFMRTDQTDVVNAASRWALEKLGQQVLSDQDQVFHALREWKDTEYD